MNFDQAFEKLLGHEGGYTDNPKDPGNWTGGKVSVGQLKGTKFGIAANTYPDLDIKNLTVEQAKAIYRRDFWDRVRADELPPRIRYAMFDATVNSGPGQAVRWLQRAVNVADDGKLGPITLRAAKSADQEQVLRRMLSQRLRFMASLSTWPAFSRGWARRIADLLEV